MIDLDKVMKEHAERVRREYERTQREKLPSLYRRALRRARRRRLIKTAGGSAVALAVAFGLVSVSASWEPTTMRRIQQAAAAPMSAFHEESQSQFGFWPYPTRELSEHVCGSSVLRGSENAAAGFAASMLQWTNVAIVGENRYGNRITSTIAELPEPFAGGPLPPHPVIKIELERLRSQNCWWVTGIGDPDDGAAFSTVVEDENLNVSFDLLPAAERADVIVVEAHNNLRRYRAGDAGETVIRVEDFRGPGSVVVLWKGSDGEVFSAAGMTLPAGDSSKRAR
ncbi:MAG: hypothetical protein KY391_04100 [Actinobacteria bacterium]|nr:hypothetical protein [Actinomycetota bacterium]